VSHGGGREQWVDTTATVFPPFKNHFGKNRNVRKPTYVSFPKVSPRDSSKKTIIINRVGHFDRTVKLQVGALASQEIALPEISRRWDSINCLGVIEIW
jgi:hypothetical protein